MAGTQRIKYATDSGSVFYVIVDEATGIDEVIGDPPAGAATEAMTIRVTRNTKEVGIRPRYVLLGRTIGTAGESNCLVQTGMRYKKVAIPTRARLDAIEVGTNADTFTIGGQLYTALRVENEDIQ